LQQLSSKKPQKKGKKKNNVLYLIFGIVFKEKRKK